MIKTILFSFLFLGLSCSKLPFESTKVERTKPIVRWSQNFDPVYDSGNLPIGTNGPLIYNGLVFIGTPKKQMKAFDLEKGNEIWSSNELHTPSARPSIYNKKWLIYGSNGGRVYSRNYLTGKIRYKIDLGSAIEATPVFYKGRGIFHLRNHKIIVLDAETGKVLWSYKRSVPFTTTLHGASKPVVKDNRIFVGFADGFVICLRVEDGSLLWEQKVAAKFKFIDVDMSPAISNNFLYAGPQNGPLQVLSLDSGKVVRSLNYQISRGPLTSGEQKYWGTTDGSIVELGRYDKEVAKIDLKSGAITGLNFWKDKILVGTSSGKFFILNRDSLSISCLLYTSPSPRDRQKSRMPSSA